MDADGAIWTACLKFPLRSHGKGESLCYTILSYVQTNHGLKGSFLHLHFESNSAIEQDEASLAHIARRNTLSWDSFTASRTGKTNLYTNLHIHMHSTWQHKISVPFMWRKIIPNSANQNRIGRFPDFSSPFGRMKSLACKTRGQVDPKHKSYCICLLDHVSRSSLSVFAQCNQSNTRGRNRPKF